MQNSNFTAALTSILAMSLATPAIAQVNYTPPSTSDAYYNGAVHSPLNATMLEPVLTAATPTLNQVLPAESYIQPVDGAVVLDTTYDVPGVEIVDIAPGVEVELVEPVDTTPTLPQERSSRFGVSLYGGTQGLGGQASYSFSKNFSVAAGVDGFQFDEQFLQSLGGDFADSYTQGPITIDNFGLSMGGLTPHLMAAYHPFGNGFRIAGGAALPLWGASASARYDGYFYTGETTIDLENKRTIAPMITLGWSHRPEGGLGVYAEIGAMFGGNAEFASKVSAADNCNGDAYCQLERDLVLDVLEDAQASLDNSLDVLSEFGSIYPLVRFGLTYAF